MNEQELKKLWDKLQGKINVGTFEVFKSKMSTPEKRKKFWDKYHQKLKDEYNFQLGTLNDYLSRLAGNQNPPTPSPTPAPTQSRWDGFPCVPQLAAQKGISEKSDGTYTIDGFTYYGNGRKFDKSTRRMSFYTCNDAPFTSNSSNTNNTNSRNSNRGTNDGIYYTLCPETLPIKRYCKNKTIKKIQTCIGGLIPDGKFGPLTQERLEELDLPGTRITADSLAKACKEQLTQSNSTTQSGSVTQLSSTTQSGVRTNDRTSADYYDDYTTFETENGDELSQNQVSTYDDYFGIEGDDETTSTSQSDDSPVTSSTPPISGEPIDIELTPKQKARNAYMYGQPNK